MRKSFDGLCGLVTGELKRNTAAAPGEVFVFLNRGRTRIKLLHWEDGGFVLYYKRLEQGTFSASAKAELSWADLVLLIEGIEVYKSRRLRRYRP